MKTLFPGVWRITLGKPEQFTPVKLRHKQVDTQRLQNMPTVDSCPIALEAFSGLETSRGYVVDIAATSDEQFYGLGLQLKSFNQKGTKKTLRVNSDPKVDLGDSHAPVPFIVSSNGYGVLVDTARYATFYINCTQKLFPSQISSSRSTVTTSLHNLYASHRSANSESLTVEITTAKGVDIYIFGGPTMKETIQRYNLFSGGGCLPPRWGLGVWYRCRADFDQAQVIEIADDLRRDYIPCDVIGLEPGWQTHSYSCSYLWSEKYPQPKHMLEELSNRGYKVNLWTHAFIHPSSPLYEDMLPYAGNYQVWNGLVPDLTIPQARSLLADQHDNVHVALGVSGYKLDECDNSDFISTPWSFPEVSKFPSGLDGEQMHSLLGINYQETIDSIFRKHNTRTYSEVRSSHALAAPYPFVLYSDLYDHNDFIRGLVNSGFTGLLWCPEVRHATSAEDLIRRLQTVVFSPQALINAWYIKNPPWKQWNREKNNNDMFADTWEKLEAACRELLLLRMQLIPYLYAAFARYYFEGIPPFRALVIDHPNDENVWEIDDQYMVGDRLLVAPVTAGTNTREVYLPEGDWFDFWTGKKHAGKQKSSIQVPLDIIPVFVRAGSLVPLAEPTLYAEDPKAMNLSVRIYGDGSLPISLFEDDGKTYCFEQGDFNILNLSWDTDRDIGIETRTGDADCPRHSVINWIHIKP